MKKKNNFMTHRPLADMHGDGVYFSDTLIAVKQAHDKEMKGIIEQKVQINS